MNEILERVNELNEVLNNGYGIPNIEWVKIKVVELQNVVKENCTIPDVINQRELLISFLTWVREDYMEDISIEYLVDYWLNKRNQ